MAPGLKAGRHLLHRGLAPEVVPEAVRSLGGGEGVGFRVWGLGFRVEGLGFGV